MALTSKRVSQISQKDSQMHYFKQALQDAGISLSYDEKPHIVTQEPSLVIRDTENVITTNNTGENVERFMTGLKQLCKKRADFLKALMPINLKKPNVSGNNGTEEVESKMQDSLMRLFLNIGCLQNEIIKVLLEEITAQVSEASTDTKFLSLLLNSLRYLPFIREPKILTEKLLDTLDIAPYVLQIEILESIPEIIPDCQFDEASKQLRKLLDSNAQLTGAIIDCLNSLNLSWESRADVQEHILERLLGGRSLKIFPILFEFLVTDCKAQKLNQILVKSRDAVDDIMRDESTDKETVSGKVIVINKLHSMASVQKTLYEGWVNLLSTTHEHKPVDLLLLFMLHSSRNTKKKAIELLFRKRVKTGFFRISSLEVLFEKHIVPQILHNYLPSITEIAASLIRGSTEVLLDDFAALVYKFIFTNPHVEHIQRQDILHSLILLTSSSDTRNVSTVLNILMKLSDDRKLRQHTLKLMVLLTDLDTFELKDVRQLFELLCGLTCGEKADESTSGFRDELHMLIRKQLTSSKKYVKQRGIIAAVVMVKHIATTSEDQSDLNISEESFVNTSDLPKGAAQDSANLLQLTNTCITGTQELMALYYDQLSAMIVKADKLDKRFMQWFFEMITQDFENVFVTETIPDPINDVPLQGLYGLNTADEVDISIQINIGGLTMKPDYSKNASILILAPLFRLLRLLHARQSINGDLASIDALLGCGIIMPVVNDVDNYDTDQIKQIADCTFYCINWFREIISAFVTQKSKKLRLKVIERLQKLVELEEQLSKCMSNVPEHKLPSSYYYNTSQHLSPKKSETKVSRPRKRFKSSETVATNMNDTVISSTAATQSKQKPTSKKVTHNLNYSFREIDTDVIILLKYHLKLGNSEEPTDQTTQQTTIDINSFKFILQDLVEKLIVLTKSKNLGLSHLNIVEPQDLITDCTRLLPSINRHFKLIVENITKLLEITDGRHDKEEMYTPEAYNLKTSFRLVLKTFALIFGWSGFQNLKNLNLLRDALRALRNEGQSQLHSANQLIKDFSNRLYDHVDHCLYLQAAVDLVKLMQVLYLINMNPDVKRKIASTSEKLLAKKWYNLQGNTDKGKQASENIDVLVKAYLDGANVKTIGGLVATLQTQAPDLRTKEDSLLLLGSIDKSNFYILFRCLCTSLLNRVKSEINSLTNNEHLVLWRSTAITMQGLMAIVKAQETRTNLTVFLKKSVGILKLFLSHGIPILEIMLRSKTDEVIEILKIIQTSTRFLHHLCCYSKLNKDSGVMAHVPQFRFTLETLVFRVKAALVANNCSGAFWMGNLKNKDLHGEDILTQSSVASDETVHSNNSDEELPADDSDEDAVEENMEIEDGTASEIFD